MAAIDIDEKEIMRQWRNAVNQKAMVKILAELYACSQNEIIDILIKNGVDEKILPKKRGRKPEVTKERKPKAKPREKPEENTGDVSDNIQQPDAVVKCGFGGNAPEPSEIPGRDKEWINGVLTKPKYTLPKSVVMTLEQKVATLDVMINELKAERLEIVKFLNGE